MAAQPVTDAQRQMAETVAQGVAKGAAASPTQPAAAPAAKAGVALAELAADAPDRYTVQRGDTLWRLATLFLKDPWRWPALWGMNLQQIRNPHRIYPGQVLVLRRTGAVATLGAEGAAPVAASSQTSGQASSASPSAGAEAPLPTVKLSPRVRSEPLSDAALPTIEPALIAPFLAEAVVFEAFELDVAPRIAGGVDARSLLSEGDFAFVLGELGDTSRFMVFREARPLVDPEDGTVRGYEGRFVGRAERVAAGRRSVDPTGRALLTPATVRLSDLRQEAGRGDRLMRAAVDEESTAFVPRAPEGSMDGRVMAVHGEGLNAGQHQIVAINRGRRDGIERGHVLVGWSDRPASADPTRPPAVRLPWSTPAPAVAWPPHRKGRLIVFRAFERVAYALVLDATEPLVRGDRLTAP
jgi:hypothetical protein